MSRVQLALNVTDLDAAVDFYTSLFGVAPAKRRPDYANFSVHEPPLKLVLISGEGGGATLNHLGVEVDTSGEVSEASHRLAASGLDTDVRHREVCCYAEQDKVWVADPDGARWEVYTVTDDAPQTDTGNGRCCSPTPVAEAAGS